jgi:predicted phage terminase large subunit-like protein
VAELTREYRLAIRQVVRQKWEFPELLSQVTSLCNRWSYDGKLSAVIIEAKSSGLPLIQTIQTQGEPWLAKMIWRYDPSQDKASRAKYAATWCDDSRGCVLLPYATDAVSEWLVDYEDEMFNYTGEEKEMADQVDATSQLILRVEHYLQRGYQARRRWNEIRNQRLGIRTTPALVAAR